jgi:DNA-binding NarL/FixJ family response regulator
MIVKSKENIMKLRILIVDDMPSMRILMKQYLCNNEAVIVVGEATNGEEALRKAQELQPDVVILDMSMPGLSGVEVARKIKSLLPNIYVYLCSAYELKEFRELNLDSPADGFIQKSSMKPELQAMIRRELERKKIVNK